MDKNDMGQNFCAVSYSGGKDSTYMLLRMIELGMPIDAVVVTVKYYVPCTDEQSFSCGIRGQYLTETGVVWKVDMEVGQTITVGRKSISFGDIVSIDAKDARLFDFYTEE